MITVFEGIDACGKQTQVQMLAAHASANDIPHLVKDYPDYETESGQKILELLKAPDEERDGLLLQSLMTVNRYESQYVLEEAHSQGKLVILDRYWVSGFVYGQSDGLDPDWLLRVHERLLQPHQWFIVDISVPESFRRRPVREDAYEANRARLAQCRKLYLESRNCLYFGFPDSNVEVLDGMESPEEIHAAVLRCLEL